jgi:hypothetical protein
MDGGIMDGWWRDVGDDDGDDLLQIPVPAGYQNGVFGSESWFLMVAAQWNSIWEKCRTPILSGQKVYVGGRRGRGDAWGGHTTPWRGLAWPAPPGGVGPLCPPRLVFWLRVSSGKIGILQYFPGFFLKVGFLHKNKTPGQFCWKQH